MAYADDARTQVNWIVHTSLFWTDVTGVKTEWKFQWHLGVLIQVAGRHGLQWLHRLLGMTNILPPHLGSMLVFAMPTGLASVYGLCVFLRLNPFGSSAVCFDDIDQTNGGFIKLGDIRLIIGHQLSYPR
jgi:hypothetical protein